MCLNQHISLKSIKLTALFLLSPLFIFAQLLTGLWTGILTNDSNSIRKDQSYEIALTEYRGKVFGYSRTEFIVHDTLYYIVKRVKGVIDGDTCEVKDDDILSYNFPTRPDKKVKVSSFFYRNKKDSSWYLAGKWKTNKTKEYYSVTGKLDLKEEKDLSASKLFPHLEELNLIDDVAFYKDREKVKKPVVMKQVEPEKRVPSMNDAVTALVKPDKKPTDPGINPIVSKQESPTNDNPKTPDAIAEPEKAVIVVSKPQQLEQKTKKIDQPETMKAALVSSTASQIETAETKPNLVSPNPITEVSKKEPAITKAEPKSEPEKQKPLVKTQPATMKKESLTATPEPQTKTVALTNVPRITTTPVKTTTESKKPEPTTTTQPDVAIVKVRPVNENKEIKSDPLTDLKKLPITVQERKSEFSQFVNFRSDSLELSLYDNGEIDGDTVSLFMNGEVLLSRQGLKATAIKKTIYLTPGKDDEFSLVLFAENLGKYPPNTGLLVVHDGEDVYNVRFSADFQTNAGVVFKRKK